MIKQMSKKLRLKNSGLNKQMLNKQRSKKRMLNKKILKIAKSVLPAALLTSALATSSAAIACSAGAVNINPEALTSGIWQTTAVYEAHDCTKNVLEQYPGVVGISSWDKDSNRFEYFDPMTGKSRKSLGGSGYFFITGDKTKQINVFDSGQLLIRKLEKLDASEFTYSRMVPKASQQQTEVKIFVVHTPYTGSPVLQQ